MRYKVFLLQMMNLKAPRISQSMSRAWGVRGWYAPTSVSFMPTWILRSSYQSFLRRISLMKNSWSMLSPSTKGLQRMFVSSEHYYGMIAHSTDCWSSVTLWKRLLDRSTWEGSYCKVCLNICSYTPRLIFISAMVYQSQEWNSHYTNKCGKMAKPLTGSVYLQCTPDLTC